jgi:acyl CoA:acetate/3-ketoacid CoA transferase beta subunit
VNSDSKENDEDSQCIYTGSGKIPLLCAAIAFVGLAVAMVVEHMYMLIAVSKATPPALVVWDPNSAYSKTITWKAGFFFVTTWYDHQFLLQVLQLSVISTLANYLNH